MHTIFFKWACSAVAIALVAFKRKSRKEATGRKMSAPSQHWKFQYQRCVFVSFFQTFSFKMPLSLGVVLQT
jgi:hypothetical protein